VDVNLEAVWRLFRDSLVDLSLAAEGRRRIGPRGCLACELLNDFHYAGEAFRHNFEDVLTAEQQAVISAVYAAMGGLEPADVECFNDGVVHRRGWQRLREKAAEAGRVFGCERETGTRDAAAGG
jgi:hypothetical protein